MENFIDNNRMGKFAIILFTLNSFFATNWAENLIVTTPLGKIQGSVLKSRLGRDIYSFRGVRFAKAPLGDLRFKPPVPIEKYEGVYNATEWGPYCPQYGSTLTKSEDCLMLNVFTTKLPDGKNENPKRPVIVFIHSGGYYSIGSPWYGPQYFMDQDIVLVTINYRLGTLGFLATGDKDAPGNYGMKDQVQALKWVRQNIASFGGDPSSVTLLGYSAGARSITLHLVSPMSKGLFHKAIALSGSSLPPIPIVSDQLELAKKQARVVGCPDDTPSKIVQCLRTKSADEIAQTFSKFNEFFTDPVTRWTPVVEKDFGQERFLTENPFKSIRKGKVHDVPFITGVTTNEFGYRSVFIARNESLVSEMNRDWLRVAPISFQYERNTTRSKKISEDLRRFYFDDHEIGRSQEHNLGLLYADSIVGFGVNRAIRLISSKKSTPSYYYKFSYQGRYSHFYLPGTNDTIPYGVVHHDDLIYLFHIPRFFPLFQKDSPKEVEMVAKLTKLYANFAKFGNPTPTISNDLDDVLWEPYREQSQKYLDIGARLKIKAKLFPKRYAEWTKLFRFQEEI